jgi:hypothetical protein
MKRLLVAIALSLAFVQPASADAVDLISLVDLSQDVVNGNWQLVDGELIMEGAAARLSFPYYPPLEYDYTVEFTLTSGSDPWDNIAQLVSHGDVPFTWSTNAGTGHHCRLEDINGHSVIGNPTLIFYPFVGGERYTSIVRVRNDRVICEINGETLVEYETDYSDLSRNPKWEMPDQLKIGLGGYGGPTTIHSATVTPPEPPPTVRGCIDLYLYGQRFSQPFSNVEIEVHLKQKGVATQKTTIDSNGCFEYEDMVEGEAFDIKIKKIECLGMPE